MQDSLSTLRVTGLGPTCSRSDGSGRAAPARWPAARSGTAQISECTAALTSAHQARARRRWPRPARRPRLVVDGQRDQQVVLGVADQVLHDALGLRVRGAGRSPAGTGSGWRTGRSPGSGPPRWRPPRPSGSPSGRPAPPSGPRRGPRSTPPAAPASWPAARRRRTGRTGTATRPAPRRTRAPRPATTSSPQSMTSVSPGDHTAGRRPRAGLPGPPLPLRLGDQAAEVAVRPVVARRPRHRQQPLRRDPTRRSSLTRSATRSATAS